MTAEHLLKFNKQQFEAWKDSTIGLLFFGTLQREVNSLTELVLTSEENELRLKGRIDELKKMLLIDFEGLSQLQEFLLKEKEEQEDEQSRSTNEITTGTDEVSPTGEASGRDTSGQGNSGLGY